jgi:NADP-dependent 3-hydroxy acid dehydrogenase YdfG
MRAAVCRGRGRVDWREKVVVVVAGASSGIGRVTARACARRGSRVVAVARRLGDLSEG